MKGRRQTSHARLYHLARTADRASIQRAGLQMSHGWDSGTGCYLTTNPGSWLFLYTENRYDDEAAEIADTYTTAVDIWEVDVTGYRLVADRHETADPKEDFVVRQNVPPERLKLIRSLVMRGLKKDRRGRFFYDWKDA